MRNSKTWNCALTGGANKYGCAAAIASNDPAEYPLDGYGVELSTYSSDEGEVRTVAAALLNAFVERAVEDGITSVLVFSDVVLYPEMVHREVVGNCTVDVFVQIDLSTKYEGELFDPSMIRRKMAIDAMLQELEKLEENAGPEPGPEHPDVKPGQYVLYRNGKRYELGRVKRVTEDGAFVWYSAGETASKTPWDCILTLENARDITGTDLGGADARAMFPDDGKGGKA